THTRFTSEVGLIKILRAERVQDGAERLIFSAGPAALGEVQRRDRMLAEVAEELGAPLEKVVETVRRVLEDHDRLRREVEFLRTLSSRQKAEVLLREAEEIRGVKVIVHSENVDVDYLIRLGNELVERDSSMVSVLFAEEEGRVVSVVGRDAVGLGVDAGRLADVAAKVLGGGGGGEPHFGQGGGRAVEKMSEAMERVREFLKSSLVSGD
ncbi:MAG: DHHA1 domain-containing protein, partial [Candidatus Bathyarchaeia archaeon]